MSGSVSGIPPTEIAAWIDLRGVQGEPRRAAFVDGVVAMDGVYLAWVAKCQEARSDGRESRTPARD